MEHGPVAFSQVLTDQRVLRLEERAAFPKTHGAAHLPRVVLRHVNHLKATPTYPSVMWPENNVHLSVSHVA